MNQVDLNCQPPANSVENVSVLADLARMSHLSLTTLWLKAPVLGERSSVGRRTWLQMLAFTPGLL